MKRPFLFRLINICGRCASNLPKIEESRILNSACKETSLTDWGSDSFLQNMRVLLDSCQNESDMNLIGRITLNNACIQIVKDRLTLQDNIKKEQEILKKEIMKPIFILGLPRTGTTLLQNLLACDPNIRPLYYWEQAKIGPPPTPEKLLNNPLVSQSEKEVARFRWVAPDFMGAHDVNPRGVEECNGLMNREFVSILHFMFRNVPTYMDWLQSSDMTETYRYHKLQLQYLGFHFPGKRWMLKAPAHLAYLKELLTVYPDALIVQAHRDPVHSVPSMCSLSTISRSLFSDTTDLGLIPAQWTQLMVNVANRSIQFREKTNNGQFLDVSYNQLVQDTLGTVQWIYDWAGIEMSEVFKEKMTTWLEQSKRRRKQNPHQYSLEQFGLTEESIQKKFESYYDQYRGFI